MKNSSDTTVARPNKLRTRSKAALLWKEYQKLYARLETHPSDFRAMARMGVVGNEWKKAFLEECDHG